MAPKPLKGCEVSMYCKHRNNTVINSWCLSVTVNTAKQMSQVNRSYVTSYQSSIVTMFLACIISKTQTADIDRKLLISNTALVFIYNVKYSVIHWTYTTWAFQDKRILRIIIAFTSYTDLTKSECTVHIRLALPLHKHIQTHILNTVHSLNTRQSGCIGELC